MEESAESRKSHKEWRRIAKRERRRRVRRQAAAQREADEARLMATLQATAEYSNWLEQCEQQEREREQIEKEEHERLERLWLEEEVRAQKEWQVLQERKLKARQQQLEQEEKVRAEFEAKQETIRKKQEEEKRKREEEIKKRDDLLKEIDDYIDNGSKTPEALREIIDSQPGKELCPFFTKTGACRYGNTCSRNHQRVCLSKVILVPAFYSHFSLEKNLAEYDTDVSLEFEGSETRQHFLEFYKDVLPELEAYGRIKTLKYCCNTEVHLRGNLYVEYYTEREAARAVRSLKGRWYAGRQLNCEFCNLKSWRSAVCGTSKCPKGRACNFLHTFRNPHDEYDIKSPPRWAKQSANQEATNSRRSDHRIRSKWEEITNEEIETGRNWRWSESPEPEPEPRSKQTEKRRRHSSERGYSHKISRDRKYGRSDRPRSPDNVEPSADRRGSYYKKHTNEKTRTDDFKNGRHSSRTSSSRSRRTRGSDDEYDSTKSSRHAHRSRSSGRSEQNSRFRSDRHIDRKESKRRSKDGETEKQRPRKYDEQAEEDSLKTEHRRTSGKKKRSGDKKHIPSKSKWDKEDYESNSSESSTSAESDSSSETEPAAGESNSCKVQKPKAQMLPKQVKDEWATTETESDNEDRCSTT